MEKSKGKYLTVGIVTNEFRGYFPELSRVSRSTIRRAMVSDLHYSYKRLEVKPPIAFSIDSIRSFHESAALFLALEDAGIEIIYIDEFTVASRKQGHYGWAQKGSKSYIIQAGSSFSMSFTVALSSRKIYGVLGKDGTNTSNMINYFIKELCKVRNKDSDREKQPFVLCFDNASIHTSSLTSKFIKSSELVAITITPYSPALNL